MRVRSVTRALGVLGVTALATSLTLTRAAAVINPPVTEAPAGFDGLTNGFLTQTAFEAAADIFAETEGREEGLGRVSRDRPGPRRRGDFLARL